MINPFFQMISAAFVHWRARQRKRRSECALSRLDDCLLDDIGLQRVDGRIVPIAQVRNFRAQLRFLG